MPSFKDSKRIISGKYKIPAGQFCSVGFEFKKNDGKSLNLDEINLINEDLIKVFEKHKMIWKMK